jgi:hypothetical protein
MQGGNFATKPVNYCRMPQAGFWPAIKSEMRNITWGSVFASSILPQTFPQTHALVLRGWLHEQFSACDLLQIADVIWCICDLVSDKNHLLSFFLHQIASQIADAI